MTKKRKKKIVKITTELLGSILLMILLTIYINIQTNIPNNKVNIITADESQNVILEEKDILQIHFFDVGQADSILLISNGNTMLIDAGNDDNSNLVVNNIKRLGIKKIDYLIGTHPHEDHIGELDDIIRNFEIGVVYMPKVTTNTKTFEDVLDALSQKDLKITSPEVGINFMVGKAKCEIICCDTELSKEKANLNLSSIVIRTEYEQQSYIFMGDSEILNEESHTWKQTKVLKVGHHGSNTSTSQEFLNQILPQIAIISVGENNNYNHPDKVILNKLEDIGTLIYRTDKNGNILIESDGVKNKVSFY